MKSRLTVDQIKSIDERHLQSILKELEISDSNVRELSFALGVDPVSLIAQQITIERMMETLGKRRLFSINKQRSGKYLVRIGNADSYLVGKSANELIDALWKIIVYLRKIY